MIIFNNKGLIPIEAIRLMGASVKTEGAFGRFGTGFKYSIATILRGGGSIRIWRGAEELRFVVEPVEMKGQIFEEIILEQRSAKAEQALGFELSGDPIPLGFTTQLGKDWEPWMALRELACNARDEGGDFTVSDMPAVPDCFSAKDGETVIVVEWDELDAAARDGELHVFAPEGEVLAEERGIRVLAGPSDYLYHRGVRVWKLPKPSLFTYDITAPVDLTEDRTVKYAFCVVANVRNMLLKTEDRTLIAAAVTVKKDSWEGSFDWAGGDWGATEPGQAWLEVVAEAREARGMGGVISDSARDVLIKHQAFRSAQSAVWSDREGANEELSDAAEVVEELGFELDKVNVFITPMLPGDALSSVSAGSIYLSQRLLTQRRVVILRELITRMLEAGSGGEQDRLLDLATERLYRAAKRHAFWMDRDERLLEEEREAPEAEVPPPAPLARRPPLPLRHLCQPTATASRTAQATRPTLPAEHAATAAARSSTTCPSERPRT